MIHAPDPRLDSQFLYLTTTGRKTGLPRGTRTAQRFAAAARVLDRRRDAALWGQAQEQARAKYGWGDGLPVELTIDRPIADRS